MTWRMCLWKSSHALSCYVGNDVLLYSLTTLSLTMNLNDRKWFALYGDTCYIHQSSTLQSSFRSETRQNLPYHGRIQRHSQRWTESIVSLVCVYVCVCVHVSTSWFCHYLNNFTVSIFADLYYDIRSTWAKLICLHCKFWHCCVPEWYMITKLS